MIQSSVRGVHLMFAIRSRWVTTTLYHPLDAGSGRAKVITAQGLMALVMVTTANAVFIAGVPDSTPASGDAPPMWTVSTVPWAVLGDPSQALSCPSVLVISCPSDTNCFGLGAYSASIGTSYSLSCPDATAWILAVFCSCVSRRR